MREYVFYILLIFLPIAVFMIKILRNYGLPAKDVAYIVITSLGIVITFPVTMERLGVLLAFTAYAIILLLVILYMVNFEEDIYADTDEKAVESISKHDRDKEFKQNSSQMVLNITNDNKIEPLVVQERNEVKDMISNDNCIVDDFSNEAKEELITQTEEFNKEIKHVEIENDDGDNDSVSVIGEFVAEADTNNSCDVAWRKNDNELETLCPSESEITIIESHLNKLSDEVQMDRKVGSTLESDSEESSLQMQSTLELMEKIDYAFQYKNEDKIDEAIDEFLTVWQYTEDKELKFLVSIELVEMYKGKGCYDKAESILIDFYNDIKDLDNYMVYQVNRELTLIRLLKNEISRLGLEEAPLADLPRWIKIKVSEEVEQLV